MSTINGRIKLKRDSTANWNAAIGMIPLEGEVIIYNDYKSVTKEINGLNEVIYIPGLKIGDGRAYVQDLPFIDEELSKDIMSHINNTEIHVTAAERIKWNKKLGINDSQEVVNGTLIFIRD